MLVQNAHRRPNVLLCCSKTDFVQGQVAKSDGAFLQNKPLGTRRRHLRHRRKWWEEPRLEPPLPHAPGARMTWVKQAPSKYMCLFIIYIYMYVFVYIVGGETGGNRPGRHLKRFLVAVAPSWLNMGPRGATGTWFMAEIMDLGGICTQECAHKRSLKYLRIHTNHIKYIKIT